MIQFYNEKIKGSEFKMKKFISTIFFCLIAMCSMISVGAYAKTASCTLKTTDRVDATTAWVGLAKKATATTKNNSSSSCRITSSIWAAYGGLVATKEQTITVNPGRTESHDDTQNVSSTFRLDIYPATWGKASGSGTIKI